jgi:MoaA/NifB/PqqE/SkfB family radical SAM enzyme
MSDESRVIEIPEPRINIVRVGDRDLLVPRRFSIETLYGCNLECVMCPISLVAKRKKGLMPIDMYRGIINAMEPYIPHLEMMDLFGLGEPLLDPLIFRRIKYAKQRDFPSVGISTNADLLDNEKQRHLLASGVDNVIVSIDGAIAETHEAIRVKSSFERVVANCRSLIEMRNHDGYETRVVVRFIRQDGNRSEWERFRDYWCKIVSHNKGDQVCCYDVHAWGDATAPKDDALGAGGRIEHVERAACFMPFEVLYILADGSVVLCSEDWYDAKHNFGNVKDTSPIEIFNSKKFNAVRDLHLRGDKNKLPICRNCTMLYSNATKQSV